MAALPSHREPSTAAGWDSKWPNWLLPPGLRTHAWRPGPTFGFGYPRFSPVLSGEGELPKVQQLIRTSAVPVQGKPLSLTRFKVPTGHIL